MHVVDCLLSHVPPYHVTAAKCLLIGPQHTQLHERAIDILKQVDDVIHLLHFFCLSYDHEDCRFSDYLSPALEVKFLWLVNFTAASHTRCCRCGHC